MRLVNYGLGEILDRLSILALKISYGADTGADLSSFGRERAALLPKVNGRASAGKAFELYCELAVVNARLWQAEDALRELRDQARVADDGGASLAPALAPLGFRLACRIQQLNDQRAEIIRVVNAEVGDDASYEKVGVRDGGA